MIKVQKGKFICCKKSLIFVSSGWDKNEAFKNLESNQLVNNDL